MYTTMRSPALRRGRKLALSAIVLLSIIGSTTLIPAPPAAAHGRSANGCTGVPDSGYGFRFHGPCDNHDRCYRARPSGSGYSGRRHCDRAFRSDMYRYCDRHHRLSPKRLACRSTATAYFYGVRLLGLPYWQHRMPSPIG
ncbi:MAG: phospholipase A2 [Acidimicrobiales bacterium]